MAKKKRKHLIKLNNKLKSIIGNTPFDVAVAEFDEELLYGLIMSLESNFNSLEPKDIIKELRRLWSLGDYEVRKIIVNYLQEHKVAAIERKKDKVDTIIDFLQEQHPTPQEEEIILAEFMDKKLSKITKEKVLNKLYYLRINDYLEKLAQKLDIYFVANCIEFSTIESFEVNSNEIELKLAINADIGIEINKLVKMQENKAIEYLQSIKTKAKEQKKEQIEHFLKNIKHIENQQLFEIFSNFKDIINNPYHCAISSKIIKKSLKKLDSKITLTKYKKSFLISQSFSTNLFEKSLSFEIALDYDKKVLYELFWSNRLTDIVKDLQEQKDQQIVAFKSYIDALFHKLKISIEPIEYKDKDIKNFIIKFIEPIIISNKSLKLKEKIARRVLYHFEQETKELKDKQKRQELLANTIRDFKLLFKVARSLKREIIFHVGPTNSGKTYAALQELKKAESGLYLAPLRLLALEGYEDLNNNGVNCSLITGEEEIIDEDSLHISSTIEMLNSDIEVDVCVIDEIQLIADRDRGWAWANALIGTPAKKVILTGSSDALDVVKKLCEYLQEPLKVIEFERKNPLSLLERPTLLKKLTPHTAIVTFSRKEVLSLKSKIAAKHSVSVVYGNLSPEVRREEAKRFREGKSDILIATDAIAMGLNLPIKSLLFARDNKFDGLRRRELSTSEILQIAGRAGRYGLHEHGLVGALDSATLLTIKSKFNKKLTPLKLPIMVMASLEHVLLISEILQTQNLYEILDFFANNMEFDGPFVAANIESMLEVAKIVDEYSLDMVSKYHLSCAPVSINSPYLQKVFHRYLKLLEKNLKVDYLPPTILPHIAKSYNALLNAEDRVKEVSLYLWLSYKFKDYFLDTELAKKARVELNGYIERTLKLSNFTKVCKKCGKELDLTYRFMICDNCYNKSKNRYKKKKQWIEFILQ